MSPVHLHLTLDQSGGADIKMTYDSWESNPHFSDICFGRQIMFDHRNVILMKEWLRKSHFDWSTGRRRGGQPPVL